MSVLFELVEHFLIRSGFTYFSRADGVTLSSTSALVFDDRDMLWMELIPIFNLVGLTIDSSWLRSYINLLKDREGLRGDFWKEQVLEWEVFYFSEGLWERLVLWVGTLWMSLNFLGRLMSVPWIITTIIISYQGVGDI